MRVLNPFFVFVFAAFSMTAQQNLNENYKPLKSTGTLPEIFTQNIRQIIQKDISDLNKGKESDKGIRSDYYTAANYEIERIVKSGNTLVNDEVSVYLNKVADIVLAKDPELRKKLSIYPLKSFVVNAYCYDKGYLFINLGLIAQAESEAQLAYTLCHEISHYTKRHNINGYVKNQKINKDHYDGKSDEDKLIEKCQYSKEQESEADIEGFKLLEQSGYDFAEAEKDFDVLQYSHLPFELVEFKKEFFESKYYKIPDRYFLKEVSSIKNISNEDDTKHTHPNTFKRKQAIHELINNRYDNGKAKNIVGEKEFEYIRDLARMELCRLYLVYRDFPSALYSSYILLKKYPNNEYLTEISAKALYGITLKSLGQLHYNSDSYLENGFPGYETVESYPQQLYHLIGKMPTNEWAILSLNYIYRAHKKFPDNRSLSSYSDTLLKYMSKINWGIVDFVRMEKKPEVAQSTDSVKINEGAKSKTDLIAKIQKENNYKNYDTAYYKDAFLDLFISDKEFASKFPTSGTISESYGFSDYQRGRYSAVKRKKSKQREYITANHKIEKVILLEPFYLKTNEGKREGVLYITSDEKQERLVKTINDCAKKQNFSLVTLDPGLLTSNEVDKMNDYSVITDWFNEKFDAVDEDCNEILNTNEMESLISKYGTHYVLKTGIISYKIGLRKRTYYYSFIFDLKRNEIVYKKYETFRDRDSQSLINAKVYQTFYELTHSK